MKPITRATTFMTDNITDPVARMGVRPNGKVFYRTVGGILYELDEDQIGVMARYGFTPRLTPELAGQNPSPQTIPETPSPSNHSEPLFWYRPVGTDGGYEGPHHNSSIGGKMMRDQMPGQWKPLYEALPSPHVLVSREAARLGASALRDRMEIEAYSNDISAEIELSRAADVERVSHVESLLEKGLNLRPASAPTGQTEELPEAQHQPDLGKTSTSGDAQTSCLQGDCSIGIMREQHAREDVSHASALDCSSSGYAALDNTTVSGTPSSHVSGFSLDQLKAAYLAGYAQGNCLSGTLEGDEEWEEYLSRFVSEGKHNG